MTTITAPRNVRASNPATTSQTKTPDPFRADCKRLAESDHTTAAGMAALRKVGTYLASDDTIAEGRAAERTHREAAETLRRETDAHIARRNSAIDAALTASFPQATIAEEFGVSRGTVSHVANGRKVIAAARAGGHDAPSLTSAVKAVSNSKAADVIKRVRETGSVVAPAAPESGDVKSALKRAESLADYLRTVKVTADDAATLAQLDAVLESLSGRLNRKVAAAA